MVTRPESLKSIYYKVSERAEAQLMEVGLLPPPPVYDVDAEIATNFPPWQPLPPSLELPPQEIRIGDRRFDTLSEAGKALNDHDTLLLGPGTYTEPLVIRKQGITVEGTGHVVFDGAVSGGKAAILVQGDYTRIRNIECHSITVRDRNGACIRLAASNLSLEHVYFHDSQQGVLSGADSGVVEVIDSRFEKLGFGGRAHGIYLGSGRLLIKNSLFLAAKGQGHEIKTRGDYTLIENSVVASLSSVDSRLIDLPSGGVLIIRNSILAQGPNSSNSDAIGYGLKALKYPENRIEVEGNVILLEKTGNNRLMHVRPGSPQPKWSNNVIVGGKQPDIEGTNLFFEDREGAGLDPYPRLPISGRLTEDNRQ